MLHCILHFCITNLDTLFFNPIFCPKSRYHSTHSNLSKSSHPNFLSFPCKVVFGQKDGLWVQCVKGGVGGQLLFCKQGENRGCCIFTFFSLLQRKEESRSRIGKVWSDELFYCSRGDRKSRSCSSGTTKMGLSVTHFVFSRYSSFHVSKSVP